MHTHDLMVLLQVEVFSDGWNPSVTPRHDPVFSPDTPQGRSILVEFLPKEPGLYSVSWMEISRRSVSIHDFLNCKTVYLVTISSGGA